MKELKVNLKKAMNGDTPAFERLCLEKGKSVVYLCIKNMGNLHDGEDAAQEVFIRMQNGITGLKKEKAFDGWMYSIIQNTCNDLRRKNMKNNGNLPIEDYEDVMLEKNMDLLPEEVVENQEKYEKLLSIINKMPHNMRMCMVLFYYEGLQQAKIADILSLSIDSVKSNIKRGKIRIRNEVNSIEPEFESNNFKMPVVFINELFKQEASEIVSNKMVASCIRIAMSSTAATAATATATAAVASVAVAGTTSMANTVIAVISVLLAGACITGTIVSANNQVASNPSLPSASESAPQRSNEAEGSVAEDIVPSESQGMVAPSQSMQEKSASTGPSSTSEKNSLIAPTENSAVAYNIKGTVKMKDKNGILIAGNNTYSQNINVYLLLNGAQVARTSTNAQGEYSFKSLEINQGQYTVKCEYKSERYGAFLGDQVTIDVSDNKDITVETIYSTDIIPPTLSINSYNANNERTKVNIAYVELSIGDETQTEYIASIYSAKSTTPIVEGDLQRINNFLASAPAKGDYTLKVVVTDAAQNQTEEQLDFYII